MWTLCKWGPTPRTRLSEEKSSHNGQSWIVLCTSAHARTLLSRFLVVPTRPGCSETVHKNAGRSKRNGLDVQNKLAYVFRVSFRQLRYPWRGSVPGAADQELYRNNSIPGKISGLNSSNFVYYPTLVRIRPESRSRTVSLLSAYSAWGHPFPTPLFRASNNLVRV